MHCDLTWQKTGLYVSEKSWVSSSESQRSRGSLSTHRHLECRFSSWLSWLTSIHCTISERSPCNKHQWDAESDSKATLGLLICQAHLVTLYCKIKMFVLYSISHGYTLWIVPVQLSHREYSAICTCLLYFQLEKKKEFVCVFTTHFTWFEKLGSVNIFPALQQSQYMARFFVCNVSISAVSRSKRGETPAQRVI